MLQRKTVYGKGMKRSTPTRVSKTRRVGALLLKTIAKRGRAIMTKTSTTVITLVNLRNTPVTLM
jgi:hypothetical protein